MADTISPDTPQKQCTGPCGRTLPATPEFFHRSKKESDGLVDRCKECLSVYRRTYRARPGVREHEKVTAKNRYARLKTQERVSQVEMKQCSSCLKAFPATPEYFYRATIYKDGLQNRCKKCWSAYQKTRDEAHAKFHKYNTQDGSQKPCSKCLEWLPASPEFFFRSMRNKDGLAKQCKKCKGEYQKVYESRPEVRNRANERHRNDYKQSEERRVNSRLRSSNRHARKRNAQGSHTLEDMRRIYTAQKGKCYWCHKPVEWNNREDDHIIPIARGGTNWPDNMCTSCRFCNRSKRDLLPHEWKGSGGRLF